MEFTEYLTLKKGFSNKQLDLQRFLRVGFWKMYCSWSTKPVDIFKFWQLDKDDELKALVKERSKHVEDHALKLLNLHKTKNIVYVKKGGKIVAIDPNQKEN